MRRHLELKVATAALLLSSMCACPALADESGEIKALQEKITSMNEELSELQTRVDKTELHTATDKLSWGVDLRVRADSIHYDNMLMAPPALTGAFFVPADQGGFNGATVPQIQQGMGGMIAAGMVPPPDRNNVDNDTIMTNRLRLNMKAKVNQHLDFAGRVSSYKTFGDSTGVKVFQGMNDVTFDGTTTSLPRGDQLRLERAYFNVKGDWGRVPVNFSLGRRPSTEGSPLEYQNYGMVGGSPLAHIINWQFDGASMAFALEDLSNIPGFAVKLCYGIGFESGWGNSYSLSNQVEDVHLTGFITTLYDDGSSVATVNYAHAFDITDGFAGLTVQPFTAARNPDGSISFAPNTGSFISRIEPATNIGDWDALNFLFTQNLEEATELDIDTFVSLSYTHTNPSTVSRIPFYEIMGDGLLSSNGDLQNRNGYGIYAGVILPVYEGSKLGFEYNYGSKYWFNFTGAEDSLVGSKLATRGSVYEVYFNQPVYSDNFFVTVGSRLYDYEYTGSGNPLGAPVAISDLSALGAINPVADKVWDYYLSATARF